jgi:hypothetical protein
MLWVETGRPHVRPETGPEPAMRNSARRAAPLARARDRRRRTRWIAILTLLVPLAACQPVRFEATTNIPRPLLTPIPVTIGLYLPEEFQQYVHKEERWSVEWEVDLGQAQTDGIKRLVDAMFERVVMLDSIMGAVADPEIRAVIEPQLEQYSFVTPRDAGAQFYAVSLKYRVGLYAPDGKLVESWPFTGYGSVEASGFGGEDPLRRATALAMRDAGAKLAVEFRQQAMVRGLLPEAALDEPLPGGLTPPEVEVEPASQPQGDEAGESEDVPEPVQEQSAPAQDDLAAPAESEDETARSEAGAATARAARAAGFLQAPPLRRSG